jgi:hypothetical protein
MIKHLSTAGRVLTPLSMVVFLTWEISQSVAVAGQAWTIALLLGAAGSAVGIEVVGILAGHNVEAFWKRGDPARTAVSLALLGAYTVAGLYILRGTAVLMPVPIIAAIVYIVSALAESAIVEDEQGRATAADDVEFQRRLKLERLRLNHKLKMEKLHRASTEQKSASTEPAQSKTNLHECEDCGRTFGTVQALNAHGRFCTGIPAKNGVVK